MESDHQEDSSSEETDHRPEQDNNDVGTGRSYECVFCKRGFTTAQALGGHMNIHRKDRAKNRPPSVNLNKCEDIYVNPRTNCHPISSQTQPCTTLFPEAKVSHRTYFPGSASAERPSYSHHGEEFCAQIPQRLSPFEDDWRMSLSLQFGPVDAVEDKEKKGGGSEDDELDLELRLGLNP